ncbi:MAG: hypothetical protein ACRCYO_13435 [Bacteroidia bacterium]
MTAKKTRGGARPGSGPKSDDPKIQIAIGVPESQVIKIGGKKKTQKIAKKLIADHAENITADGN